MRYTHIALSHDSHVIIECILQSVENAMEGDAKYMARELISRQFSKAADIFR